MGKNCKIEAGACIRNSVLLDGACVRKGGLVTNSIIGWNSTVGKWARVKNYSVLGEDVKVKDEVRAFVLAP